MAVYVSSGGSGTGTTANMGPNGAIGNGITTSLFTTPNVPNTLYLVDYGWIMEGYNTSTTLNPPQQTKNSIKVGPNVPISIDVFNITASIGAAKWQYSYVGIIIDTN